MLRQRDGHLTRDLVRTPGGFGLGQVPARHKPDATADLVCGYCSTGCRLTVHLKDGAPVNLTPSPGWPVNRGTACPKGWEALTVLDAPDRATTPLLRDGGGSQRPVSWDLALHTMVARIKAIQDRHGADSVAFLGTGQMPTEEMALLGALAKSDVIVFVGANPCIAHPIMWERVLRNPRDPAVVVVDPRFTETAMQATQHLPLRPKSDQALLYGIARILIERGWIDSDYVEAHTREYEPFAAWVQQFTLDRVAADTGLEPAAVERLAATIHDGERVSFWWTMGVNQSYQGVRTAQAIIDLALLTGNIGRPGTGANSITGQCNAMGSRLFSNTTNLLGGHDFADAGDRAKVAGVLGIDPAAIPREPSWAYHEIVKGILEERIKGLWVIATNTAHSWINQSQAHDILGRLDFLVVQDMYASTETARMADLVLPAAAWGEKDGTFINSEWRIGTIRKVAAAPGEALADFGIFKLVAEYWGCGEQFREWASPEAAFQILKRLSAGQPCDITGIADYAMLDERGGIQWPCPADRPPPAPGAERRLFEDGRFHHADGRARFLFEDPRPLPEPPGERYPFLLLTGRGTAAQWHTQTRTAKSAVLRKLYPEEVYVEINPAGRAFARHPAARSRRGPFPARPHQGDRLRHPVRAARAPVRAHALPR